MRRMVWLAIVAWACVSLPAWAQPTGVARMTDLWNLPVVEPGIVTFGESSHDHSGLNEDGFAGLFSRLYYEDGLHVLYDAVGPGCVYRMWFTLLAEFSRLVIYVDDQPTPVLDRDLQDFFFDGEAPFTPPLVWNDEASSGGFVSYVPICYQRRLKIGTTGWPFFYNFTAHAYRADTAVTSFAGEEDYDAVRALYDPAAAGEDPKDTTGVEYQQSLVTIDSGTSAVIFAEDGGGQIASLRLTPASLAGAVLTETRLVARFDDAPEPQIDAPLGQLFGADADGFPVSALLFGIKDGRLFSFLPMPYFTSARLELVNDAAAAVAFSVEVGRRPGLPDDYAALLHAEYHHSAPNRFGRDHVFAAPTGQGQIVGVVQLSRGQSGLRFLEGDERFTPDGLRSPLVQGTGTEDYYNGGWYFNRGTFSLPTHGHPLLLNDGTWDEVGMYRLHMGDTLTFYDGAVFSIEHDMYNQYTDEDYQTVAYMYRIDEPALVLEDEFDVGNAADEERVQYFGTADEPTGRDFYFYEGDHDLQLVVDEGYASSGEVGFTVLVRPGNDGVRLVRRLDQSRGREAVRVWINDQDAGLWRTVERNTFKRWRDAVFDVPPALTQGETALAVRLENASPARPFTHYRVWVYSWKRPLLSRVQSLQLSAPAAQMHVGEMMQLAVVGDYLSGATVEVSSWVDYEVSDAATVEVTYGRVTALAPGVTTIAATHGDLGSNSVQITVLPGDDDDNDDDDDNNDNDDDSNPPPASGDDEDSTSACGC